MLPIPPEACAITPMFFDVRHQICLAVAGKIDIYLPGAKVEIQPCHRNIAEMEIALSGSHIDAQFQRNFPAEAHVPFILRITEMHGLGFLGNLEVANPVFDAVIDLRLSIRAAEGEVRIHQVIRGAVNVELAGAHFQLALGRLGSLNLHRPNTMTRAGAESPPRKPPPV